MSQPTLQELRRSQAATEILKQLDAERKAEVQAAITHWVATTPVKAVA